MFSLHSWNSLTWKSVLHVEERTSRKKKFTRLMRRPIRVIVYVWDFDGVSDDTFCEVYEYAPRGNGAERQWGRPVWLVDWLQIYARKSQAMFSLVLRKITLNS